VTRLLYVTGVSCAGKTHLGRTLAEHPDADVTWDDIDIHARERPTTAWLNWLHWRAAELLVKADDLADTRHPPELVIVTGISWPFRVIESPAWHQQSRLESVEWLLLDPPWKLVKARLNERLADKPKSDRRETIDYNRSLRRTLRDQVESIKGGYVSTDPESFMFVAKDLVGL